jgi:hypothetical protein
VTVAGMSAEVATTVGEADLLSGESLRAAHVRAVTGELIRLLGGDRVPTVRSGDVQELDELLDSAAVAAVEDTSLWLAGRRGVDIAEVRSYRWTAETSYAIGVLDVMRMHGAERERELARRRVQALLNAAVVLDTDATLQRGVDAINDAIEHSNDRRATYGEDTARWLLRRLGRSPEAISRRLGSRG